MSQISVQDLSPEIIEMARKLSVKKKAKAEKARANLGEKYPWVKVDTLEYDEVAKKNSVQMDCVECGATHRRYTSDLFQTKGVCPDCMKEKKAEGRREKNALMKKAMELLAAGDLVLDETEGE